MRCLLISAVVILVTGAVRSGVRACRSAGSRLFFELPLDNRLDDIQLKILIFQVSFLGGVFTKREHLYFFKLVNANNSASIFTVSSSFPAKTW